MISKGKDCCENAQLARLAVVDTYCDAMFSRYLAAHLPVEIVPPERYMEADFLLYGDFGFRHAAFQGVKIFITGENHAPNFCACDYAFTHERVENERHMRLPVWVQSWLWMNDEGRAVCVRDRAYTDPSNPPSSLRNRKFCNFVYRNPVCKQRNRFFHLLSRYKRVDSGGPLFHNMDGPVRDKVAFQKGYKFTIAFENESSPGYQTEKLWDALRAGTVPIYWGNRCVAEDFNPKAFISAFDFPNLQSLAAFVRRVDEDDELYVSYLNEPIYAEAGSLPRYEERFLRRWADILSRPGETLRSRSDRFRFALSQCYGHAMFYHLRRLSRWLRGKK